MVIYMAGIRFTIKKNRLEKAFYQGMTHDDACKLSTTEAINHNCILPLIDSGIEGCEWNRLRFMTDMLPDSVLYVYVAAIDEKKGADILMNSDVTWREKLKFLSSIKCLRFINKADMLLYEISGRYLWLGFEIIGEGADIKNIEIEAMADNFMNVFPEVYREKNSFMHRYLSVFSNIHYDLSYNIEHRDEMIDAEKASKKMVETYIKWLGIDVDGSFLEESLLRELLKKAPELIKYKGTKRSIEQIFDLFIGEKPSIVERNLLESRENDINYEAYDNLYGRTLYDVTLLINTYIDEHKKEQLLHLIKQFKPVRSRLHIVFLKDRSILDGHSYLDENAITFSADEGMLDLLQIMDDTVILQ